MVGSMENLVSLFNQRYMTHGVPADYQFYLVKGTKVWYAHGDVNDREYNFLVAAPDQEHAEAWVKYQFLANSDCCIKTKVDLEAYLEEAAYDSENGIFHGSYEDWTDMGEDILRHIDSCEKLVIEEVNTLLKFQMFDDSNLYR